MTLPRSAAAGPRRRGRSRSRWPIRTPSSRGCTSPRAASSISDSGAEMADSRLERVLRRDRALLLAAIAALAILAWAHIIRSAMAPPADAMAGMAGHELGPGLAFWSAADFLAM